MTPPEVQVPAPLAAQIERIAEERGVPTEDVIAEALRDYLGEP